MNIDNRFSTAYLRALIHDKNYWNQRLERAISSGEKDYDYENLAGLIGDGEKYSRMVLNSMAIDVHLNPNDYKNKKLLVKAIVKEYLVLFEEFPEEKTHFEKYFYKIYDSIIERFMD